jgi:hypothetical protein
MEKVRLVFYLISILAIVFIVSCNTDDVFDDGTEEDADDSDGSNLNGISEDESDYVWSATDVKQITLNGSSVTVSGTGATANGSTLTISAAGNYSISGKLSNGKIIVHTTDDNIVRLIFNGVDITCSNSAPVYISKAGKVLIYLSENTTNSLTDGSAYSFANSGDTEPNAAVFSTANLSIAGTGSLTVRGNYNDGISTKDGLIIKNGKITVTSADDAIRGKDYVVVREGTLTLTATGDGIVSDNSAVTTLGFIVIDSGTFNIVSGGDAIQAVTEVIIKAGDLKLTSGGGSSKTITNALLSAKGIKAGTILSLQGGSYTISGADDALHSGGSLSIAKGTYNLSTSDDAMHAEGALTINGGDISITKSYEGIESPNITVNSGNITLVASNDGFNASKGNGGEQNDGSYLKIAGGSIVSNVSNGDGIDSNGNFDMTGGTVVVHGPQSQPEVGLDVNGTSNVTGGFLIISGTNSNMTEAPSTSSTQYSIMVKTNQSLSSSTLFNVQDGNGNSLVTFQPVRSYYSMVFSSESLKNGSVYYVYTGGTSTGTNTNGLYTGGTYTGGTQKKSFTISSKVTTVSF